MQTETNTNEFVRTPEQLKKVTQEFLNPNCSPEFMDLYIVRNAILTAIKKTLPQFSGTLLDVGCGIMPYRELLTSPPSKVTRYLGMDIATERYIADIDLRWDGNEMPLPERSVDCAMATEVMEHSPNPALLLSEVKRVLRPGGLFFFTVPFIWPLHDVPGDFFRYTSFTLKELLSGANFTDIEIHGLGGWNASLAQLIGLWVRRSPLEAEMRKTMESQLFPFFKELIDSDKPVDPFKKNSLATGWWGTARA